MKNSGKNPNRRGPACSALARAISQGPGKLGPCMLVVFLTLVVSLPAGTVTGTVRARGAEDAGGGEPGGAYASRRYKFVERLDYEELRDFVVYIDQPFPDATFTPPKELAVISQKDAAFVPHVLPVLVGTTVEWPNLDDIYHNVFCMAETKPFDLGLYKSDHPPKHVVFDKLGQADVFCAIHTKMHCIVLVLANPYFSVADAQGRFTLRDVPAGTYQLRAWHERVPGKTVTVTVPTEGEVKVDFVSVSPRCRNTDAMDESAMSRVRLNFQLKVLLPVLGALVLLPVLTLWIVNGYISRQMEDESRQSLNSAENVFQQLLDLRTPGSDLALPGRGQRIQLSLAHAHRRLRRSRRARNGAQVPRRPPRSLRDRHRGAPVGGAAGQRAHDRAPRHGVQCGGFHSRHGPSSPSRPSRGRPATSRSTSTATRTLWWPSPSKRRITARRPAN
ncbi:MAG: hypothetical protein WDM96_16200 [Lacunisphaera sp.]